jgi:putative hemolysin
MRTAIAALAAVTTVFLGACDSGSRAPAVASALPAAASSDSETSSRAAAYCTQTGGEVEIRHAVYGSNGSQLLFLAGVKSFCQYTRKKDGSRIHILLSTLYTTKPTLAALAYILKPPPVGSCQGNPASCYCSQLGASDQFGGASGAGGGWYKKNAIDETLEACIFPDMSSIDSWGLAYHAEGIIRGTNLEKVMRYKYPGGSSPWTH